MLSVLRRAMAEEIADVVMRELFDDETLEPDVQALLRRRVLTKVQAVMRAFA